MTMGIGNTCNLFGTGLNIGDDDRGGLYRSVNFWSPRGRGAAGGQNRHALYFELWRKSHMTDDNAVLLGTSEDTSIYWEDQSCGEGGVRSSYFIKGQVVDSGGTAQSGVLCMAFRTSDNLYVASAYSDSSGNYNIPTPYTTSVHFVVAYLDIATDLVGTTVNNLTPSATPY